jgi:hypothetical protein
MNLSIGEKRSTITTISYWCHGIIGGSFLANGLDPQAIGLLLLLILPIPVVLAIASGLFSIQTTVLSLLLIVIYITDVNGPTLYAYVLAWFLIIGYRIFRIVKHRYQKAG